MHQHIGSSRAFYDALAADYDALFEAPHRRAYDELAWELVEPLLPASGASIIDAGCGTGRWSSRLIERGHAVVGVEESNAMARIARDRLASARFELVEESMETVHLDQARVDAVLALGSLQYAHDRRRALQHLAGWLRHDGWLVVLVDSLVALGIELLSAGKMDEAVQRLETREAVWVLNGQGVGHHLFDRAELEAGMREAGLVDVRCRGLLVGSSIFGRAQLTQRLTADWEGQLTIERRLAEVDRLVDLGKQLLVVGRRP